MNLLLVAVPPWRIRVKLSTVMLPSSVPRWQADAWGPSLISWDAPLPVPPPARFLAEGGGDVARAVGLDASTGLDASMLSKAR